MMDAIKKLRDKTSAGVVDCKKALKESGGDIEKAIEVLRKQGAALASKKAGRTTKQGCIESYIHLGGKIGVMVEVNCESDFVARNDGFKSFVKDIAMQIAASSPLYLNKADVPAASIAKETEIIKAQIKDILTSMIAKIGENIVIKRFVRWNLGEEN
jgi:elongation factor Ts